VLQALRSWDERASSQGLLRARLAPEDMPPRARFIDHRKVDLPASRGPLRHRFADPLCTEQRVNHAEPLTLTALHPSGFEVSLQVSSLEVLDETISDLIATRVYAAARVGMPWRRTPAG